MRITSMLPLVLFFSLWILSAQSKTVDPYKVLGVEQNASQREIQKAFHKLSLQYHPDKNKNKGAEAKFAEINNAYDILSDEEKRKIFDLYGDEKGSTGFDTGHHGDRNSYTHFTSGGPGHDGFSFNPDGWQNMGGSGGSKSFSFSFGGPGSRSFGFGLDDVFSNFFGGDSTGGGQFGGFTGSGPSGRSQSQSQSNSRSSSMMSIRPINRQVYTKEIADKGITWLLLSYTPTLKGTQNYESIIEEASSSLRGALKVGSINCESESSFCKELGIHPRRSPRLFVYSYQSSESGSFLEYTGDVAAKSLKMFCQEHLPRFSKRVNLSNFEFPSGSGESLPKVMLLSTKKDTPIIWRALSGLYRKSFIFYDTEVHDVSDPAVRRLGVDALPAIVGWLSNGEKHVLKTGITVKDLESAIRDLSQLLDGFEKKNNAARNQGKKTQIPLLMASNFNSVCGEKTPVCIIGAFRSSKAKEKLETILLSVSQKSLSRRQSKNSISYAVVDAAKQPLFLNSFDKSGFKSQDKLLIAYKPRKGTYSILAGDEINPEEVERFVGSVLNGDVRFSKTRQKPVLK